MHFRTEQTLAAFEENLVALPGIGPWTAHYVAMRALGQPDAFPGGGSDFAPRGRPTASR